MIYPADVELKAWIKKYDLKIEEYICPKCKKGFKTDVPFLTKEYAGLETREHECGPQFKKGIVAPRTAETANFWGQIIREIF